METLTMSTKEVPRPGLFRALVTQKLTVAQVALALKLTIRQVRRLLARYRTGGAAALVHRSRGRPSKRRLPKEVRAKVLHLIQTTYQGLSDCHLTEKLTEVEGLSLCRESVRRLRESLKLAPQRRRRPPRHHQRRIPEARLGAMIQVDGSPFDWLQGRGPMMSLLGGVDDASSRFTGLIFRPHEDLHGYASVFHQTFTRYGLPGAFYGDRTGILHRNDAHWSLEEELQGSQFPTQLGSALHELGIGYIAAHSPQAKGRVENRWGTLQDRLTSELRLRDIDTLEGANLYLPEFSEDFDRRFAHPPREAPSAFRSCSACQIELALCCRYTRQVARDNTVSLAGRWVQIPPGPHKRSYAGSTVELRELLSGKLLVRQGGRVLAVQEAPPGPFTLAPRSVSKGSRDPANQEAQPIAAPGSTRSKDRTQPRPKSQTRYNPRSAAAPENAWRKGLPPARSRRTSTLEG
jgi:transposase